MARRGGLFKAPRKRSTKSIFKPAPVAKKRSFYDPQKHGLRAVLFGRPKRK